eukprot:490195-Pyramimonas_sp.AAC.1
MVSEFRDHNARLARKRGRLPGGASGDLRLLGRFLNSAQRQELPLSEAMELVTPEASAGRPHPGPEAVQEFLESDPGNG